MKQKKLDIIPEGQALTTDVQPREFIGRREVGVTVFSLNEDPSCSAITAFLGTIITSRNLKRKERVGDKSGRDLAVTASIRIGIFSDEFANSPEAKKRKLIPTEEAREFFIFFGRSWKILDDKKTLFRIKYGQLILNEIAAMEYERNQQIERHKEFDKQARVDARYNEELREYMNKHNATPPPEWVEEKRNAIQELRY